MPRSTRKRKKRIRRIISLVSRLAIFCIIVAAVVGAVILFIGNNPDVEPTGQDGIDSIQNTGNPPSESDPENSSPEEENTGEAEPEPEPENSVPEEKYRYVTYSQDDINRGLLILVNNQYAYEFPESNPDFVDVYEKKSSTYKIRDTGIYFNGTAMEHFDALLNDFYNATNNHNIIITSCFRDYAEQERIMNNRIASVGEERARLFVANPGNSEHHTGLAVDIGIYTDDGDSYDFRGEGEYGYINENCYKFGFIVRYLEEKTEYTGIADEPWHFRYLGAPHAEIITKYGLCMEEYISFLKAFSADGTQFTFKTFDGDAYVIYFVKSEGETTNVPVPLEGEYTVSGNNIDGFIVTAKIQ